MKNKKLTRDFFSRNTRVVARELLGKFLVRPVKLPGGNLGILRGMITETEAYCGPNDLASHASRLRRGSGGQARGRTPRAEVMFGNPGLIYIYLIYGMYHCLNIVTEKEGYPAAVLIRGVTIAQSAKRKAQKNSSKLKNSKNIVQTTHHSLKNTDLNGPGRVCRYFQIDRGLNRKDIVKGNELWVEDAGVVIRPNKIKSAPRIGIDYAGKYKDKKWRYRIEL